MNGKIVILETLNTVWKSQEFAHTKKSRQINDLAISLVKALLSRNFCQKKCESKVPILHSVVK